METIRESVKYTFTRDELVEIAREQARHHGAMSAAEEAFENIKAQHKTKITRIDADIADCTRRVSSGYEMREVECLVLKFRPDNNHALIVRTDSGRVLRKRKLAPDEKQTKLSDAIPDPSDYYAFVVDLWHDGGDETVELAADGVQLTVKEAEKLYDAIGKDMKPIRKALTDGVEEAAAE